MKTKINKKTITPSAPPAQLVEEKSWHHIPLSVLAIFLLMLLQGILVYPLFQSGYSRFIENIESAHIANATYILQHWGENWNNQWYFGFPTHLTYPPIIPYLIALVSYISNLEVAHVYRIVTAVFIILTPLSIYLLSFYLTRRKTTAFLSSLLYIILPSVAYLFIPQIIGNTELSGYAPFRYTVFAQYGEGPHLASLFFIPLAIMYFIKSYRQPDVKNYIWAAVFIALTMLTNLFGGFALLMLLFLVVTGKLFIYVFDFSFIRLIIIGLLAYGLTAFAYDFGFIGSIMESGYIHPENSIHLPPFLIIFVAIIFGILPAALLVRGALMGQESKFKTYFLLTWFLLFLTIPVVYYHFGYSLVPQPNRYLPELQMGFVILLAIVITRLFDHYQITDSKTNIIKKTAVIFAVFALIYYISSSYLTKPYYLIQPSEMNYTNDYKIAVWLDQNIDRTTGERAYLTGTPAFWLTAFNDVPEIRGGADNAQPNPWWADIAYQINKGDDAEITTDWLQLMNVKYILVNYPESGTHYVDYENTGRFEKYELAAEFADGGFKMFKVPESSLSLLSIVNTQDKNYSIQITDKKDTASIKKFAEMVRQADVNDVHYQIVSPSHYEIGADNLDINDRLIFKMNYDPRWRAVDQNGHVLTIEKVGPNFMMINPDASGSIHISLSAGRTWTEYLGLAITIMTMIIGGMWIWHRRRRFID